MKKEILNFLDKLEYGTLALCADNVPYSLPINFVTLNGCLYFHGSKKGRKVDAIKANANVSFSAVEAYSIIASYMSSKDGLACPATQFFKSVIVDGKIEIVQEEQEKIDALNALMSKLQSEGGYKDLNNPVYKKSIAATNVFKLTPSSSQLKLKFGQKLNEERFNMIIEHLQSRAGKEEIETIKLMKEYRDVRV